MGQRANGVYASDIREYQSLAHRVSLSAGAHYTAVAMVYIASKDLVRDDPSESSVDVRVERGEVTVDSLELVY